MSGPTYSETVYDGETASARTRALFVYLPVVSAFSGALDRKELIAAAIEHRRPAHESYKGATFWHIVTVLNIPGVDHEALKALEANDETTARAWLAFIAGLAEIALHSGEYVLRHGPALTVLTV
jgi:hypothetical protein